MQRVMASLSRPFPHLSSHLLLRGVWPLIFLKVTTAVSNQQLYCIRLWARPPVFFLSRLATLGVCPLTFSSRAREPWTLLIVMRYCCRNSPIQRNIVVCLNLCKRNRYGKMKARKGNTVKKKYTIPYHPRSFSFFPRSLSWFPLISFWISRISL